MTLIPHIRPANAADMDRVRSLFLEYANSLGFSLCFQGFDQEIAELPGDYISPHGILLLAWQEQSAVGCVGLRRFDEGIAEMKRLYVQPAARGLGLGRALTVRVIDASRAAGYRSLRLDTLSTMTAAIALYVSLGFHEVPPYRINPIEGARYFELSL